jgi:pimeloyl-ACP methyl ester carboxylesterase
MTMYRTLSLLALTGALCATATLTDARARPPWITWSACPAELTGGLWPALGDRLHCGRARMPLDHLSPDGRTIEVGVVRVAAADSSRREGALFINIGGPGGHPGSYVASMAASFSEVEPTDPLHGDKRRLVDRYDLVAVVPRGLKGGWTYECKVGPPTHAFLPAHRDDANWARLLADARTRAAACSVSAETPYLSTEQHVRDMDAVRQSLGDETLHFYGISYGGRVGATYAALFPEHTGRLLLDSSLVFSGSYRDGIYGAEDAQQHAFERDMLGPIQRAPARFGQSATPSELGWAVRNFSDALRPAWHDALVSPYHLAAALTMDGWVKNGGWPGWNALGTRAASHPFGADGQVSRVIRAAARDLVEWGISYRPPTGKVVPGGPVDIHGEWINLAVMCNDEAWETNQGKIRARADRDAFAYTTADGSDILDQLTCAYWPRRVARSPDFSLLTARPPFVLIQADGDRITPINGARLLLRRFPNARLIVAKGTSEHGLFGRSDTPCIERDALAYLLDGRLPAGPERETSCRYVPRD